MVTSHITSAAETVRLKANLCCLLLPRQRLHGHMNVFDNRAGPISFLLTEYSVKYLQNNMCNS